MHLCNKAPFLKLEIIHNDDVLVAINKPHGLLVHRTNIASDANEFALQILRDQLNMRVFPCHRIDRKTSGVLLFAKEDAIHRIMQMKFSEGEVHKKYLAIVRGFSDDEGIIDADLKREDGLIQQALTNFKTLERVEIDLPFGAHNTSRYSLVEIVPETGRTHQIRKHLAHIHHPIIGDRPHGCNKQNKLFKEKWNMRSMLLHASLLSFNHPLSNEKIEVHARPSLEFYRTLDILGFSWHSNIIK